ncbi:MAG: cellulase family glycosylhydrolase [Chitinivibrionales bacterium]|nr:cellulase family glycosylhydrolase [Chitinivibrionales bacterium]
MHMRTRSSGRWKNRLIAPAIPLLLTLTTCDYIYYDFERLSENPVKATPFTDSSGRICIYHGVNVSNYAKHAAGFTSWHTKDDFARLQDWGFNIVRYLVFWEALEPTPGAIDTAYLNGVLLRVQWLQELGIDVILDMHQDLYSSVFGGNGFPPWTVRGDTAGYQKIEPWQNNYLSDAVMSSFRAFWTNDSLRAAYLHMLQVVFAAAEPYQNVVGVDVMNEPFQSDIESFEAAVLSAFYEQIIGMVSDNGFTKKILFEPSIIQSAGIPSALSFGTQGRCVYAPHFYDMLAGEVAYYGSTARLIMQEAMFTRVEEAVALGCPLLFGEYGISPSIDNYLQYLRDFNDEADKHLVGRIYWSYDRISHSEFGIIDDAGVPRPNMDALVRVYPQRIMGRDPEISRTANRFSLNYTRTDGTAPTEIFIPAKLANVTVTVNGIRQTHSGTTFTYYNNAAPDQHIVVTWE